MGGITCKANFVAGFEGYVRVFLYCYEYLGDLLIKGYWGFVVRCEFKVYIGY